MLEETVTWFLLTVLSILVLSVLGTTVGFIYMIYDDWRTEQCQKTQPQTREVKFRLIKKS